MKNEKFLFDLLKTPSPSGFEYEIQKKVIEEMKDYRDKLITSSNYNVINCINPDSKMKVLLSGHIDEIGLVVNNINADGTCSLVKTGGVKPQMYTGQHVNVMTETTDGYNLVPGVIGYCPNLFTQNLKVSDLILDLGTNSKEETLKLIKQGDPVVHMNDYVKLASNKLSARALDDRLGAFICLEVLKRCKERNTKNGVYASTTVGEETTYRGAHVLSEIVKPSCAVIVDVTYASDIKYAEGLTQDVKLGNGPALTKGSIINHVMETKINECAKKLNINVQNELFYERTYTDTDAIYNKLEGVPVYLISIPLRYMHSSVEVCDLNDVEDIINLITEFICSLDENQSFNRFEN